MSFLRVYIHFVWSTKHREPLLNSYELRSKVWMHMKENAASKGVFIDTVNGYKDHCHALIALGACQTPSLVMQLVKGESSYWINKEKLCKGRFEWQRKYYGASVSDSSLDKVRQYIKNQEDLHSRVSFDAECDKLVDRFGFSRSKMMKVFPDVFSVS